MYICCLQRQVSGESNTFWVFWSPSYYKKLIAEILFKICCGKEGSKYFGRNMNN